MENQKKKVWLRKALFLIVKGIYDRRTDHWRQCSGERND